MTEEQEQQQPRAEDAGKGEDVEGQAERSAKEPGAAVTANEALTKEDRNMAMLCHLAAFATVVGIPLGNIVGPLIVWLIKREQSSFVDWHGKESINFQISVTIYGIVGGILIVLGIIGGILAPALIGLVLLPLTLLFALVMVIVATMRANDGLRHQYPLTMRFIK